MKLAWLMMAALIHPVFAGGLTQLTQTNQTKPFDLWSFPSSASTPPQGWTLPGDFGTNWSGLCLTSTNPPVLNFNTGKAPADGNLSLPSRPNLQPGVYKTSPYTLLVMVPGPQHDDSGILKSGKTEPEKMPVIQGGLKFTPYSFAEK